jgi:hypothetical protein
MRIIISSVVLIIVLSACTVTSQNVQTSPQSTIIPSSTYTKAPTSTIQVSKTPLPLPSATPVPLSLILEDFPLMVGTIWEYSAEISYQDPNDYMKLLTWKGIITEKVIDKKVIEGGIVIFTIQEDLEPIPPEQVWRRSRSFKYTISGDGVFEGNMKVYQYPLEDNMKWKAFSGFDYEMLAQPIGNVKTPYGELDNCYVFITATNPDTSIDTFCKGIGFVEHSYRHHGTPQDEKFVLSSFILGQP